MMPWHRHSAVDMSGSWTPWIWDRPLKFSISKALKGSKDPFPLVSSINPALQAGLWWYSMHERNYVYSVWHLALAHKKGSKLVAWQLPCFTLPLCPQWQMTDSWLLFNFIAMSLGGKAKVAWPLRAAPLKWQAVIWPWTGNAVSGRLVWNQL